MNRILRLEIKSLLEFLDREENILLSYKMIQDRFSFTFFYLPNRVTGHYHLQPLKISLSLTFISVYFKSKGFICETVGIDIPQGKEFIFSKEFEFLFFLPVSCT